MAAKVGCIIVIWIISAGYRHSIARSLAHQLNEREADGYPERPQARTRLDQSVELVGPKLPPVQAELVQLDVALALRLDNRFEEIGRDRLELVTFLDGRDRHAHSGERQSCDGMDQSSNGKRVELIEGYLMDRCEVVQDPRVMAGAVVNLDFKLAEPGWPVIDLRPGVLVQPAYKGRSALDLRRLRVSQLTFAVL